MHTTVETFLVAIATSLIATILWIFLGSLFIINGRKKNKYLIDYAISSNQLLQSSLNYNDYQVALSQVEKIIDLLFKIESNIGYLNYCPKKRKLIHLLIFNSVRILTEFKGVEIGLDKREPELIARCERFKKRYYYNLPFIDVPHLNLSLDLISKLNEGISIKKALSNNFYVAANMSKEDKLKIYNDLIEINSFFRSDAIYYYMRNKALSKSEYDKLISGIK